MVFTIEVVEYIVWSTNPLFTIPPAMRKVLFQGYELADGKLLIISDTGTVEKTGQRLIWLAQDGSVAREKNIQLAHLVNNASATTQAAWAAVVSAPMVLAFVLLAALAPLEKLQQGTAETYLDGLGMLLQEAWPAMLIVMAIGAILAVLAYRRQRRYGLPHAAGWGAFIFILGIPGWIADRFHRTWPVLEDCPSCGQPAPRDREACLDCGAPFPPPPPKGIEVFA